jgi:Ion transport protein
VIVLTRVQYWSKKISLLLTQQINMESDNGTITYEPLAGSSSPVVALASSEVQLADEIDIGVLPKVEEEVSKELSGFDSASSVDASEEFAPNLDKIDNQQDKSNDDKIINQHHGRESGIIPTSTDRRNEFANSNPKLNESQASFRVEWTVEQMNSNFAQQSWYREFRDSINNVRYRCGMVVNNKRVQTGIIIMISINAIMMGLATFDFVKDDPVMNYRFELVDKAFLIIFTIELGLQFIYHGFRLLLDGWLVFDLIIITVSWSFASVQIVRAFRIFRALRLVTRIKIMKNLILGTYWAVATS